MADIPQQLPAVSVGEWNYINTVTAPPASGQVRMDNVTQTAATHLWFDKTTATSADASAALMGNKTGQDVSLANKSDPTKAQVYTLTANPADKGSYVDYPVVWKSSGSGGAFPAQRTTLDVLSTAASVPVTGMAMTALVGAATVNAKQSIAIYVTAPVLMMKAEMGQAEIAGQQVIFDYAYPFQGRNYTNPGLTIRQWYATHAMTGFIAASNTNAANLIGKLAIYAFQVADSMLAYEEKERQGYTIPVVGGDRNAQAPKPATPVPPEAEPAIKTIWPRKIIS